MIERLALSLVGVGATKEGRECLLETGSVLYSFSSPPSLTPVFSLLFMTDRI